MLVFVLSNVVLVFALIGALTLGVFIGIRIGRQFNLDTLALLKERIISLERLIELKDKAVSVAKESADFYKSLLPGDVEKKTTLDG